MVKIREKLFKVGATRLFMTAFVLLLLIAMPLAGINLADYISNVLVRIGMNGIMVLAMLTSILCGAGVNYGLPLGILSGLLGGILSLEWNLTGWLGLSVAILISVPVAALFGGLYGILLNNVKGSEGQSVPMWDILLQRFSAFSGWRYLLKIRQSFGRRVQVSETP